SINDDDNMSQEVRDVAQQFLISNKTDILQANNNISSPSPPTSSSTNNEKKGSATDLISTSSI
ncbi:9096_t:CDS:2, partial [Funneliformis caledonium]